MRITFQPKRRDKTRLMLPISEFNLVVFPVQVRHVFPRVPNRASSPIKSHDLLRRGPRKVCP
ncbi:MAG: hypothetical protein ABSE16_03910 [Verrucomicrobiota bacterium]|jgi:hypothetical protein